MSEKKSNILIPNAVGRLDPVVHAIRAENWDEVQNLLIQERVRLGKKISELEKLMIKEDRKVAEIKGFYEATFNTVFRERVLAEANQ